MHPRVLGDGSSGEAEAISRPRTILASSAPGGEPPRRIAISTLDPSHDTPVRFLPKLEKEEDNSGVDETNPWNAVIAMIDREVEKMKAALPKEER